jgi:hypothetical protein
VLTVGSWPGLALCLAEIRQDIELEPVVRELFLEGVVVGVDGLRQVLLELSHDRWRRRNRRPRSVTSGSHAGQAVAAQLDFQS